MRPVDTSGSIQGPSMSETLFEFMAFPHAAGRDLVRLNRQNKRHGYCNPDQRNDKRMADWKTQVLNRHIADWALLLVAADFRRAIMAPVHPGQFTTSAKKKPAKLAGETLTAWRAGWTRNYRTQYERSKKPVGGLSGDGSSVLGNPAGKSDCNWRRCRSKQSGPPQSQLSSHPSDYTTLC
jgi:hypothetical protein